MIVVRKTTMYYNVATLHYVTFFYFYRNIFIMSVVRSYVHALCINRAATCLQRISYPQIKINYNLYTYVHVNTGSYSIQCVAIYVQYICTFVHHNTYCSLGKFHSWNFSSEENSCQNIFIFWVKYSHLVPYLFSGKSISCVKFSS